jgi:hypothetical protein
VTLEQLRVFVAVAERQHVTRAAAVLNLAQSAVSAAIAALEARRCRQTNSGCNQDHARDEGGADDFTEREGRNENAKTRRGLERTVLSRLPSVSREGAASRHVKGGETTRSKTKRFKWGNRGLALKSVVPIKRIHGDRANRTRDTGTDLAVRLLLLIAKEDIAMIDLAIHGNDVDRADTTFAALAVRHDFVSSPAECGEHRFAFGNHDIETGIIYPDPKRFRR